MRVRPAKTAAVERAVGYVRENYAKPLRVASIAALTPYSERGFRRVFREVTGHGVVEYVVGVRVERARELLRSTDLPVLEIAHEVGFGSLTYFNRAFKKVVGQPPAAYRRAVREGTEADDGAPRRIFSDDFRRESPGWKPLEGRWRREEGALVGSSGDDMQIGLTRELPESFRLEFRFRVLYDGAGPEFGPAVRLFDPDFGRSRYKVTIGDSSNRAGSLTTPEGGTVWSEKAVLRIGEEQSFRMDFVSGSLSVWLDGEEVFSYREAFPARYAERSALALWFRAGRLEVRSFALSDLGPGGPVPAVRLGDAFFNEGMLTRARRYYSDLLDRVESGEDRAELQYKIGAISLALGKLDEAESRLRKLAELPGGGFWSDRSRLALVRVQARREEGGAALAQAELLERSSPHLGWEVANVLSDEAMDLYGRGFFERALRLYAATIERSKGRLWQLGVPVRRAIDCCVGLRRFARAEQLLRTIGRESPGAPGGDAHSVVLLRTYRGDLAGAERALRAARRIPAGRWHSVVLFQDLAIIRRGQGRWKEALDALERADEECGGAFEELDLTTAYLRVELLCAVGKTAGAKSVLRESRLRPWELPTILYVPWALEGRYERAAGILAGISGGERLDTSLLALTGVMAGMLMELGGRKGRAAKMWKNVERRFPPHRVHFAAGVAAELAGRSGSSGVLEDLPYDPITRSEVFYWAGRLFDRRGDHRRATRLMKLAVKEDPTRRWPAVLARRELGSSLRAGRRGGRAPRPRREGRGRGRAPGPPRASR